MSKNRPIKWNQNQQKRLEKAVRNFNNKITRLEKKDPRLKSMLPERIDLKDMKENIKTATDLNREVKALSNFSHRKNVIKIHDDGSMEGLVKVPVTDYNLIMTKWQKRQMKTRTTTVNRRRKEMREAIADIEMTDRGKKRGYTKGDLGMGKMEEHALQDFVPFTERMNRRDMDAKFKNLFKESSVLYWDERGKLLKNNYIKAINENFNVEDPRIIEIIEKIEQMDFKEFRKVFEAENEKIGEYYQIDDEFLDAQTNRLHSMWLPEKHIKQTTKKRRRK